MTFYYDIIRELREDNGLKQEDVAELLGTTQQVYSRYELGLNQMPIRYVAPLCKLYNVTADYILCLTDEPAKSPAVDQTEREAGRIAGWKRETKKLKITENQG